MKEYNPIEEEKKWWNKNVGSKKPLPPRHHFAHNWVRSKVYDTLIALGCDEYSTILDIGCGSGEDVIYISKASKNIIGVDISPTALKRFTAKGFQGILADARTLPFQSDSFDYVIAVGLLHHLIGQGDLKEYLREFVRVARGGDT